MRLVFPLALCLCLLAGAASAQETPPPPEVISTVPKAGNLDVRLSGDADLILAFATPALSADYALTELGPGVITVGGKVGYGFCITFCFALSALTGTNYSQRTINSYARATYHYPVPLGSNFVAKLDTYAVLMMGLVHTSLNWVSSSFVVEGSDLGLALGIGAGASYFVSGRFFVGAELLARLGSGTLTTRVVSGQFDQQVSGNTWSQTGLGLTLLVGMRLL
jgi:hypothetical protein